MPFEKGHKKMGGRKAGVPNKLTASGREMIQNVAGRLGGEQALYEFAINNPDAYWTKLFKATLPTTHAGSKDEPPIQHELNVILGNMR